MMTKKITWFTALALGMVPLSQAETAAPPLMQADSAAATPVASQQLGFKQLAPAPGSFALKGTSPVGYIQFGVRHDEVVTQASLQLEFTPSPTLTPVESHLKVYLNEVLMGVVAITKEQVGQPTRATLPLDPRYITDFNRVRLEFVGHYKSLCQDPSSSSLWLNISQASSLNLQMQKLPLKNDLAAFPIPFFDARDNRPLTLPMVFNQQPDLGQQQAAAILASWFGARAQWRGQSFPALFNQLPDSHAVVFATNAQRPDFLRDYPPVNGPTVEVISHPQNPYVKLLLVQGRDDNDLITAVKGIAQGNILFRGQNVSVDRVEQLAPRQPYDAPNWIRTDRPMTFAELQQYPEQLQSSGIDPDPLMMTLNLPPDLFLIRSKGIDMHLKYRYTAPRTLDGSRLAVNLNNQFVQAFNLVPEREKNALLLRLPITQGLLDSDKNLSIPALKLGTVNELRFDFDYATVTTSNISADRCETIAPIENHAVIDGNSTINFSGYRHFMAMPDLRAFANAGFPFSRLADLSQTVTLIDKAPPAEQVSALLNAIGNIGAQTGYPALALQLTDDPAQLSQVDKDILLIGSLPESLRDEAKVGLLTETTKSWVKMPVRQTTLPDEGSPKTDGRPDSRTDIRAETAMATIIGTQSPYFAQRSLVALLADSPQGYTLLNNALIDSTKRATVFGSAAVIRDSGVSSLRVGDMYYVGHLPWWERVWHALALHPLWLAGMSTLVTIIFAWLLWRGLKVLSRRRLSADEKD